MGRIMVCVGALAAAGMVAAGVQGWRAVETFGDHATAGLQPHILLALVSVLVAVLAHGWGVFYLTGTVRLVRGFASEHGRNDLVPPRLGRFATRTVPPVVGALAASFATFLLGTSAQAGWVDPAWHAGLFVAALVLQIWALAVEWSTLEASERTLRELTAQVPISGEGA